MDTANMNTSVTNINKLGFDRVWSGAAYETQRESLNDLMTKLNKAISDINTFDQALDLKEKYVKICERIATLYSSISTCSRSHTEEQEKNGCGTCSGYRAEINQKEAERKKLRIEIIEILSQFEGIEAEVSGMLDIGAAVEGMNWDELVAQTQEFMNLPVGNLANNLTGKYDENGVYIEDGLAYMIEKINSIKGQHTDSTRAYYVSMAIIDMCLLAGVRPPYEHRGTGATGKTEDTRVAVPISTLNGGIDCNAFVSMVLFDENTTTKWLEVQQYTTMGEPVNYEDAQPGDVFATGGHVGIIVANNPETGEFIIMHASSHSRDMCYEVVSYDTIKNQGGVVRRVDSTDVHPRLQAILDKQNQEE